jgi:hypothetical protein
MMLDIGKVKKIGLFASGVLFGTAGVKVLGSKDAKKFYINCLAAGLRAKDCVMTTSRRMQKISLQKLRRSTSRETRKKFSRMRARQKSPSRKKKQQPLRLN